MSFLPSALNLYAPSTSSSPSGPTPPAAPPAYKPATLCYFTIFAPALRPTRAGSEDAAAEAAQILFYTSRERAVSQDRMLRQIGIAKGLVEFGAMVADANYRHAAERKPSRTLEMAPFRPRSWNVHSSKRRLVLLEVQQGVWIHASIDLPSTARKPAPGTAATDLSSAPNRRAKESRDYHDAWLSDDWIQESILSAWRDWRLLHGPPARILRGPNGRKALERALERYFSVWVWSWNLESTTPTTAGEVHEQNQTVFTESLGGIDVVPSAPRSKLVRLMKAFGQKHLDVAEAAAQAEPMRTAAADARGREFVILLDTSVLWPPTDAGCFDAVAAPAAEADDEEGKDDEDIRTDHASFLEARDRVDILRRVISHLTGLERERALIRAAAAAGISDSKRKSVTGAIRDKSRDKSSAASRQTTTAAALRLTMGGSPKSKAKRDDSSASTPSSLTDAGKWSAWGGVFANLGKNLTFKGQEPEPATTAQVRAREAVAPGKANDNESNAAPAAADGGADSSPSKAPEKDARSNEASEGQIRVDATGRSEAKEASGPFQALQQRLADAMPIQDTGKIWIGAETAWKGLGASLGLNNGTDSPDRAMNRAKLGDRSKAAAEGAAEGSAEPAAVVESTAEVSDQPAGDGANAAATHIQPEVDVAELAAALDDDGATNVGAASMAQPPISDENQPGKTEAEAENEDKTETDAETQVLDDADVDAATQQANPADRSDAMPRSPSVSTTESSKAFPSISVTSAAWYSSKPLKSSATGPVTSSAEAETMSSKNSVLEATIEGASSPRSKTPEPAKATEAAAASIVDGRPTLVDAGRALASVHHDFELDGWGDEEPAPFQSFHCFIEGTDAPLSADKVGNDEVDAAAELGGDGLTELRVSFTSRKLLTFVLIERFDPAPARRGSAASRQSSQSGTALGSGADALLVATWELLRRAQRMLNDHERLQKVRAGDEERASRFVHLDGPTLTVHNRLNDETAGAAAKLDDEAEACAQGHCMAARSAMAARHGIRETFARSNNGKTWVASRLSAPVSAVAVAAAAATATATTKAKGEMAEGNVTYMLMGGRSVSIVDCDNELRRLANEFGSFGI
ncbi:hypothetical protein ACQY0O_004225 [Thecaphora frezii]